MKTCPFCVEQIQDEAIKCRWCGEMLPESTALSGSGQQQLSPSVGSPLPRHLFGQQDARQEDPQPPHLAPRPTEGLRRSVASSTSRGAGKGALITTAWFAGIIVLLVLLVGRSGQSPGGGSMAVETETPSCLGTLGASGCYDREWCEYRWTDILSIVARETAGGDLYAAGNWFSDYNEVHMAVLGRPGPNAALEAFTAVFEATFTSGVDAGLAAASRSGPALCSDPSFVRDEAAIQVAVESGVI